MEKEKIITDSDYKNVIESMLPAASLSDAVHCIENWYDTNNPIFYPNLINQIEILMRVEVEKIKPLVDGIVMTFDEMQDDGTWKQVTKKYPIENSLPQRYWRLNKLKEIATERHYDRENYEFKKKLNLFKAKRLHESYKKRNLKK